VTLKVIHLLQAHKVRFSDRCAAVDEISTDIVLHSPSAVAELLVFVVSCCILLEPHDQQSEIYSTTILLFSVLGFDALLNVLGMKINVLKGERFEVNPEEINVTFDDVKGVSLSLFVV